MWLSSISHPNLIKKIESSRKKQTFFFSIFRDGKPYFHRKPTDYSYVNPNVASQRTIVKPLSQGLKESIEPLPKSRMEKASFALDSNKDYLLMRLNDLKREQENAEKQEQFNRVLKDRLSAPQFKTHPKMFPETLLKTSIVEDDDQSILDQHVSRVFSPLISPGTASPRQLQRHQQHRNSEMSSSMPDFGKDKIYIFFLLSFEIESEN